MIWILTIVLVLVMGYSALCLAINAAMGTRGNAPYWLLLMGSAAVLYVGWYHPVRITIA